MTQKKDAFFGNTNDLPALNVLGLQQSIFERWVEGMHGMIDMQLKFMNSLYGHVNHVANHIDDPEHLQDAHHDFSVNVSNNWSNAMQEWVNMSHNNFHHFNQWSERFSHVAAKTLGIKSID